MAFEGLFSPFRGPLKALRRRSEDAAPACNNTILVHAHAAKKQRGRNMSGLSDVSDAGVEDYEQPLVDPQVSHFRQVPFRTMVKLPHSEQLSPS